MTTASTALLENETVDDAPEDPALPEKFHVHDDGTANWVVRQIVERRAYAQRCAEWCDREQRRAKHEEEFFLFRFGPQLLEFARGKIAAAGGRRKSVSLPAGTMGFRSEAAKLVIDDEGLALQWAKTNVPEAVVVVERLSKSAINSHLEETGEMPSAGAHIEPGREKFFIK